MMPPPGSLDGDSRSAFSSGFLLISTKNQSVLAAARRTDCGCLEFSAEISATAIFFGFSDFVVLQGDRHGERARGRATAICLCSREE